MRGHFFRWAGFLSVLWALPLQADVVEGLYLAEVPVESQSREERQTALGSALKDVLIKVSGRNLVLTADNVEATLENPTRYVQRYRYVNREDEKGNKVLHLWVRFDEKAVNELLRNNQLNVWGKTRPATLVWLVIDDRKGRTLLSNDKETPAREILEEQARQRGLPLRLPLYDLADRAKITVTDIWGNFEETILQASTRYQTEAVLVGRVYLTYSNSWSGRWTLYSEGRRTDWESSGETLELAMLPGAVQTADFLSQRYAQSEASDDPGLIMLRVSGVNSLPAYTKTIKYLNSLEVINQVQPRWIDNDSVLFEITSRRDRVAVSQAINLGHTLVAQAMPANQTNPTAKPSTNPDASNTKTMVELNYQLVP